MWFPTIVIRVSESKFPPKKVASLIGCILENLCVTNLIFSDFTNLSPYFAIDLIQPFKVFHFWEKRPQRRLFFITSCILLLHWNSIYDNTCVTSLNFSEMTERRPYFETHENSLFQTFWFFKKTSAKKTFFSNFQSQFISHWVVV